MSETTAHTWTLPESTPAAREAAARIRRRFRIVASEPVRRARRPLLTGLTLGALLGGALTALATWPVRMDAAGASATALAPATSARALSYQPPKPALGLEWRSYRTPVEVDRMFRRTR